MTTLTIEKPVARPTTTPLKSSILDHASVGPDMASFGLRNNEGLWTSFNCIDTLTPTMLCPNPLDTKQYKDFQSVGWVPAFEFAVYGGVQCNLVGLDVEEQKAEVSRVFALNEGKGIEQALVDLRFADPGSDDQPWGAAEDITPAGAVSLPVALALLEGHAAKIYAGVPTLHLPRAAASVLNERIVWQGDKAFTRNGSKVAMGGGYDLDDASDFDGTFTLYATGEVYIEKSKMVRASAFARPGDGTNTVTDEYDISHNTNIALAERMYRVAVDCFVAKITATIPDLP